MIEDGGCLPPLLSSVSLQRVKKVTKKPFVFPIMETARRCFPAGCLPDIYALRIIPYPVSQEDDKNGCRNYKSS